MDRMISVFTDKPATVAAVSVAATAWMGCVALRVHQADWRRLEFNETDWKVDGLATPAFFVRFLNAGGLGPWFGAAVIRLLRTFVLRPALNRSLEAMREADERGVVPKVLCNANARADMRDRLDAYYADIVRSPTMNQFGKILNYAGAITCLQNHAGLIRLAMREEVQQERIVEPVFIVSFSRTGTTILHRTMALDRERWRNFDVCDMLCPLPIPAARWDEAARREKAKESQGLVDGINAIYPGWMKCLETMHGIRPGEADEDMIWYNMGLGHMYMDPLMRLYQQAREQPGGMSHLESKEVAKYRYAWLSMVMRIHQWTDEVQWQEKNLEKPCPTTHLPWLMKDPNHSAYLPELLDEFPDAKLIFTHRSPSEIVPSLAKLMIIFNSMDYIPNSPGASSTEMGAETVKRMKHYANGIVEFTRAQASTSSDLGIQRRRTGNASLRRVDFDFRKLVGDIPGSICTIYKQFYPNLPGPSNEANEAFVRYLETNSRERHGNQTRRSLEDFHLTSKDVEFKEYHDLFLSDFS